MTLPKQIEEAADLAEQLHAQMFAPQEENEQEEETVEEAAPQEEAVEEDNTSSEDFRHKYEVLEGKYKAEVPRLHQEIKELKESVFKYLGEVNKPKEEQKPQVADEFAEKLEKFREEYGNEFVEMFSLVAKREAETLLQQRIQPIQDNVDAVEETQIQAAKQNFSSYLDGIVQGNWRDLWAGKDEKFVAFLQQPDPSGLYTYGDLVRQYNDNWDADKLGKVFNIYLESNAPKKQEKQEKPRNPAADAAIAPQRNTQAATPTSTDKIIWTSQSMAEFQKNDRMGKYDADTSKAMWEDLLSAPAENRIR